jgi:tRNA A37 threonylcarbamoyladenosine synthetase subunit TsaC/SUA5/YrdC
VSTHYDLSDPGSREEGVTAAVTAVRRGQLVVLPTDTVYGVGADAFDADAVQRLLDAKGRGRDMPPPVLVGAPATLDALSTRLPIRRSSCRRPTWPRSRAWSSRAYAASCSTA